MKRKTVCIVTPVHWSFVMGGIEYQVKLLTEYLISRGDCNVTYIAGKIKKDFFADEYKISPIPGSLFLKRYGYFPDVYRLIRLLKKLKPDVIYENGGCAYTGAAVYYALRAGCRMIWHVASDNDLEFESRGLLLKPHKFIERKLLNYGIRKSPTIIAQSSQQKEIISKYNRKAKISIIKNHHPVPALCTLPPKKSQIVWVANIKELKQPEIFIKLAEELSNRKIKVNSLMIGSPSVYPKGYQEILEEKIKRICNLKYLGKLNQIEVNQVISKSKLLVNTSKWEGFPNTFIQAWLRETPVVSLSCDPDDVIEKFKCGILSGTIERMIDDVSFLLGNDSIRMKMGSAGRKYAVNNHSEKNLKTLTNIILDI